MTDAITPVPRSSTRVLIESAVQAIGSGPLTESAITRHLSPLFQQVLRPNRIYLASHTLGRPLDLLYRDVEEALSLWTSSLRDAWPLWLQEEHAYRASLAMLLQLPQAECVVPKASAGQALRAVLNTLPHGTTVLTTSAEFASVDSVLDRYATLDRIHIVRVAPTAPALLAALRTLLPGSLVIASHVLYASGQILQHLDAVALACRERNCELLIDCYHSLGALPISMPQFECGFMIGGCYKYLRGGPGAAFLAIAPRLLPTLQPLDIGWFAQPASPTGTAPPSGDSWLEGTPAILPYYQARSGLAFVQAIGVERLRAYQLQQSAYLCQRLSEHGVAAKGGDADHGAFVTVPLPDTDRVVHTLAGQLIVFDAREGHLRLCADCLVTQDELQQAAAAIARAVSVR